MSDEIVDVRARRVWDSRGWPTVEAEVHTASGVFGRAIAPAGASTGRREATDLRDGGRRLHGRNTSRAVALVRDEVAPALLGTSVLDQSLVDQCLDELDPTPTREHLGGNTTVAVSMASAHAAAAHQGVPLWRTLADPSIPTTLPMPEIQLFGGGVHAAGALDLQDIMIVPASATSFDQALETAAEIYHSAGRLLRKQGARGGVADEGGWWPSFTSNEHALALATQSIEAAGMQPGQDVFLSLDIAANEIFDGSCYRLQSSSERLDPAQFIQRLSQWIREFPIVAVEDPLVEEDLAGLAAFTAQHGRDILVVGDDVLATNADRVQHAVATEACNTLLVKPNQTGTLTAALRALTVARNSGWSTIVSARSGESEDVTVAHLAVGWAAGQIKVGSMARSERLAKWNELLRIEEQLGEACGIAQHPSRRARTASSERPTASKGRKE